MDEYSKTSLLGSEHDSDSCRPMTQIDIDEIRFNSSHHQPALFASSTTATTTSSSYQWKKQKKRRIEQVKHNSTSNGNDLKQAKKRTYTKRKVPTSKTESSVSRTLAAPIHIANKAIADSNSSSSNLALHNNAKNGDIRSILQNNDVVPEFLHPELEPETDPETSLDLFPEYDKYNKPTGAATTVHWNPLSRQGRMIGHRIRVYDESNQRWKHGRVLRYDPISHRHKIMFFYTTKQRRKTKQPEKCDENSDMDEEIDEDGTVEWMNLNHKTFHVGEQFVWALVKGFAWWPALIYSRDSSMIYLKNEAAGNAETSSQLGNPANNFGHSKFANHMKQDPSKKEMIFFEPPREGYVLVEFFNSGEIAFVKNVPDFIQPFAHGYLDLAILKKNKKKLDIPAMKEAQHEEEVTRIVRNKAAYFYADRAFAFANRRANYLIGRRVQFFRSDINYPKGDMVIGTIRQYSVACKKWLVVFDPWPVNKAQYEPIWFNILAKDSQYKFLDQLKNAIGTKKNYNPTKLDLSSFLFGYEYAEHDHKPPRRCHGCFVPCHSNSPSNILTCSKCSACYHLSCIDPSGVIRSFEKSAESRRDEWICNKCITCIGCRQHDIAFGVRIYPKPPSLHFETGESLTLCSVCAPLYDSDMYCPVCAHTWDDVMYQKIQGRLRCQAKSNVSNEINPNYASNHAGSLNEINRDIIPKDEWFYPDTKIWGYTEDSMIQCDACNLWVHAGCAALSKDDYEKTIDGKHNIYSNEYLCRSCCKKRCFSMIQKFHEEDSLCLFAAPVTDQIAHNYYDVIKEPMDLKTMSDMAARSTYHNYAWIREAFELMVYNALTYNGAYTPLWDEARRFYDACLSKVFGGHGKGAPPSKYHELVQQRLDKAMRDLQAEREREQTDCTAEKKDLIAGAQVVAIQVGPLSTPVDPRSYIAGAELRFKAIDAFYCSWMECCFVCGSSGAMDTMLFCVDCGEAFHSFCVNAPIQSMTDAAAFGWRCPNCKVCEVSGDIPVDDTNLVLCEMCDRAFSIDRLDPPLQRVPSYGLWICGFCIDCKICNNLSGDVKRNMWSQQPEICFRCGGAEEVLGKMIEDYRCNECRICSIPSDNNLISCGQCYRMVHHSCDKIARLVVRKRKELHGTVTDVNTIEQTEVEKVPYRCPSCRNRGNRSKKLTKNVLDLSKLSQEPSTVASCNATMTAKPLEEPLALVMSSCNRSISQDQGIALCDTAASENKACHSYEDEIARALVDLRPSIVDNGEISRSHNAACALFQLSIRSPMHIENGREHNDSALPESLNENCTKTDGHIEMTVTHDFLSGSTTSQLCFNTIIGDAKHGTNIDPTHGDSSTRIQNSSPQVSPSKCTHASEYQLLSVMGSTEQVNNDQKTAADTINTPHVSVIPQNGSRIVTGPEAVALTIDRSIYDTSQAVTGSNLSRIQSSDNGPLLPSNVPETKSDVYEKKTYCASLTCDIAFKKDTYADKSMDSRSPLKPNDDNRGDGSSEITIESTFVKSAQVIAPIYENESPSHTFLGSEILGYTSRQTEHFPITSLTSTDKLRSTQMSLQIKGHSEDLNVVAMECDARIELEVVPCQLSAHANAIEPLPSAPDESSQNASELVTHRYDEGFIMQNDRGENILQASCVESLPTYFEEASCNFIDSDASKLNGMLTESTGSMLNTLGIQFLRHEPPLCLQKWRAKSEEQIKPLIGWASFMEDSTYKLEWKDTRFCCLCMTCGDDDAGLRGEGTFTKSTRAAAGRLLPMSSGSWVHLKCGTWSSEVWEDVATCKLQNVHKARSRGIRLKCFGCGRFGATIGCNKAHCPYNYHYLCALACGALFTCSNKVYCKSHKDSAKDDPSDCFEELMKCMRVADNDAAVESDSDSVKCLRIGALVVHSLGVIEQENDGFYTRDYITPPGFTSSRIFWSFSKPRKRTLYLMRILKSSPNRAKFSILAADDPQSPIEGDNVRKVYGELIRRVRYTNKAFFSYDDLESIQPVSRSTNRNVYGMNGSQFFGFGVDFVRKAIEGSDGAMACAVPWSDKSEPYRFCFVSMRQDDVTQLQRKRALTIAEKALQNTSGCARAEGMGAVHKSVGSGRITRALVRQAREDSAVPESSGTTKGLVGPPTDDYNKKYQEMKAVSMDQKLAAKRSHIHGWGLFAKTSFAKHSMIIEYMGETISQTTADKREKEYEKKGIGSCYMFRLDLERIVDATNVGCMARFINHCCSPNSYAKVICVTTDLGLPDKKIVVFADKDIQAGEEITYDYKFPVEDGSLRCSCGAPNCIGRMN